MAGAPVHRDLSHARRTCSTRMQSSTQQRTRAATLLHEVLSPLPCRKEPRSESQRRSTLPPSWLRLGSGRAAGATTTTARRSSSTAAAIPGSTSAVAARHRRDGRRTAMTLARQAAAMRTWWFRASQSPSSRSHPTSSEFRRSRGGHCILGSCAGSAYMGGQP